MHSTLCVLHVRIARIVWWLVGDTGRDEPAGEARGEAYGHVCIYDTLDGAGDAGLDAHIERW